MPWWLSAIALGLRLLGLASWAEGLYARWQAKREGIAQQRADDNAQALAVVTRERDALMEAGSAEEAARRDEF